MSKHEKIIAKILEGKADANISFDDLYNIYLGFEVRVKGSYHIFRTAGIEEKINIQKEGVNAKPYQVKQLRKLLIKYQFGGK